MRVLVVGASGAIGTRLVPQLVEHGHEVIGTSRSPGKAERLRALGAEPVALDLLDARAVRQAVLETAPEAIIHQATALADAGFSRNLDRTFAPDQPAADRGHRHAAGRGARGGRAPVRRPELRPLPLRTRGRAGQDRGRPARPGPAARTRETIAAMRHLDEAVTAAGGIALRYGGFYGAANDGLVRAVRKRQFPIVGDGGGVMSFIHLDDAAAATVLALEHGGRRRLQHRRRRARPDARLAAGARRGARRQAAPPRPALARAADHGRGPGDDDRGPAAPRTPRPSAELGWTLRYPSWRQGFAAAYGPPEPVRAGA